MIECNVNDIKRNICYTFHISLKPKHGYLQRFYRDKQSQISKIGKFVMQHVKIIHSLNPFYPKFSGVSKERGYGVMTKKRESNCGENSRVRDG